ncbi:2-amino-4-hydroxy-6-hydroxymethyldihydropteridine diphosphokinase [Snodgrassella sp. CFCC 13594]|uniref:2-amino-4-hydroxy-6- hydroxymethyldihydropteridine diphosphokinase n=1 Tax=Snodgrassella sp. CFCC 13594 TaxID=1775559 RepID=UPI00082D8A3F|nr:2-amino-4-hydroxy-6-hydroxymethyldihydropteridine diphosphokinase [Snodgrassella sp. CFCC 13594]
MRTSVMAVIALGSNLDQPAQQVQAAIEAVGLLPGVIVQHVSSLYQTKPVGYAAQPDFVNAVMLVSTTLDAHDLLQALQNLENRFGRVRSFRNAPRTLDLDIVDYGGQSLHSSELDLPHPRAHERAFVMVPLAQIMPDYPIGEHGTAVQLAQQLLQNKPDEAVAPL